MKDKRFIEDTFPVKDISLLSAKGKNISHGNISTLHRWWARRPLASSRASIYAALIPALEDENQIKEKKEFIEELAQWQKVLKKDILDKARKDILFENKGNPPRILDPFAGGGSIPLEALRLGCEVHAIDYNPVANIILKCTLEYPQKYANYKTNEENKEKGTLIENMQQNTLVKDIKKWSDFVLKEAKKEIGKFYKQEKDGSIPIGYIWARTIRCQNPSCKAEIPLMRQFWLSNRKNRKIALYPYIKDKEVNFKIVGDGYQDMPEDFDPSKGTVSRAKVLCPVCGYVINADTTRRLFQEDKSAQRLVAVILHKPKTKEKDYRLANKYDVNLFKAAQVYLDKKRNELYDKWNIDPVPAEKLPPKKTLGFGVQLYNIMKWGDLFNSRQKLALITFIEKVKIAYDKMLEKGYNKDYAKVITTYLAITVDNLAEKNNNINRWATSKETVAGSFSRQILSIVWDYLESIPFSGSTGDWKNSIEHTYKVLEAVSKLSCKDDLKIYIKQASATNLPYPDNYFDAIFADPPYYDNIPYSYLSDFFYVWLKRSIGNLYPDLFITPLTPKSKEIVAYSHRDGGLKAGKQFFEDMLNKAFKEMRRVLKPDGIAIIVYSHKSTSGWETLINSLIESELIPTASWPIDTEKKFRILAKNSAALASSIYLVCRKIKKEGIKLINEVQAEIKRYIHKKLERLWHEGISGADFFISAIGASIEIFGKYKKIIDYNGEEVSTIKLLDYVRKVVTDYTVNQILQTSLNSRISPLTRFYILFRWIYLDSDVIFDEARKLSQAAGINLDDVWNKTFIKKKGNSIKVLSPLQRDSKDLDKSKEMIDVLHKILILTEHGNKQQLKETLLNSEYAFDDTFYKVAQAISETLPNGNKEKKLLDTFLASKERIIADLKSEQSKKTKRKPETIEIDFAQKRGL